jgi:shikimate kinase
MNVTLIGYRGSGKSAVAAPLARRLGWTAIDADHEIESRAGRSIREIFERAGEPEFRRLERETLADLLSRDQFVIAAGGGAILDEGTRDRMRQAGPVVWLRAPADVLFERIAADPVTAERRPNLTAAGGLEEIVRLLSVREPLYRDAATLSIDVSRLSVEDVVKQIIASLPPFPRKGA